MEDSFSKGSALQSCVAEDTLRYCLQALPYLLVNRTLSDVSLSFLLISRFRYRDGTTGNLYQAQVALQLRVKPGFYRAGRSHREVDANELLDQNIGTENLEWYLTNQGLVVLTALLIKIEPT